MDVLDISHNNTQKHIHDTKKWKPVTTNEVKAFVGVILNMVIIQLQNLQDYWSTILTSSIPFFSSVFYRDGFFFKSSGCYMSEKLSVPEKKDTIQPFIDLLVTIIQESFTPHSEVAVDESVITFKG